MSTPPPGGETAGHGAGERLVSVPRLTHQVTPTPPLAPLGDGASGSASASGRRSGSTRCSGGPLWGVDIRSGAAGAVVAEQRRLTERDRWLIGLLAEHRVLTADEVAVLGFDSLARARRRLRLLHERGVLARFRRCVRPGSQPWRYTLGPVGEAVYAATSGAAMPRPAKVVERVARLAASPTLEHLLATNRFFVGLLAAARGCPGCGVAQWWSARRTAETTGEHVRPDGYGHWFETSGDGRRREVRFFLEYDRGRENLSIVVGKLDRYHAMTAAAVNHPVLFVFGSAAREHHFRIQASRAGWPRTLHVATTTDNRYLLPAAGGTPPGISVAAPAAERPGVGNQSATDYRTQHSPADRIWLPLASTGPSSSASRTPERVEDTRARRALLELD